MSKYGLLNRPVEKTSTKKYVANTQKKFVRGVLLLIITTLLIIFIFGDHGVLQLYKLKKEQSEVQSYISQLRKDREILFSEKNKLENDLKYIEKLARERYRMAKPGEKVFKVVPKSGNNKK